MGNIMISVDDEKAASKRMIERMKHAKKLGIKTVSGLTVYAILNNIVTFEEISA